jgi:predicted ATP-grasp superfamily ATP-dependent carboligase
MDRGKGKIQSALCSERVLSLLGRRLPGPSIAEREQTLRTSLSFRFTMKQNTVLVGFAEASAAPEVAWSLADQGFRVVAFARKGRASAVRHSRYVECHEICPPEVDVQASLSDLNSLLLSMDCRADSVPRILFPLDDKAVWLTSKASLRNHWLLAGPRDAQAELALNKGVQTRLAEESGFNVPKTGMARSASEVFEFIATQPFPIILKAAECVPVWEGHLYTCRKWICSNLGELERGVAEWGERVPLLLQSFVTGTGEGVFGLAAPDGVRAWSAHRRLRMMNPQGSGSSACVSQTVPDDLKRKVETMIDRAGWRGLFMIELLRDRSGGLWFVELNGRPWGSISLSRRQALEYPAWHVQLALDSASQAGVGASSEAGVVCRNAGREFLHLLFVLRGPRSKALSAWPSFWKTMRDVVRFRRGETVYNWRREDPKVFLADFYSTVKDNLFKSRN